MPNNTHEQLRPFVSNLDQRVFAITGLPEEVIAALLARYSRSRDDLRTNLNRLLAEDSLAIDTSNRTTTCGAEDKARAFHEKWAVGYGHASVAEHAVVHLAVEQVSIIASKSIEDLRLGSFTEKSTRYVVFDTGSFADLAELPSTLHDAYRTTCMGLFADYLDMFRQVEARLDQVMPKQNEHPPSQRASAIRAHTCDLLRGLLPASTLTNLGITANARALAILLRKMLSSPLREVRSVAEQMRTEASTVAPTLLRYVESSPYRTTLRDSLLNATTRSTSLCTTSSQTKSASAVRIVRYDRDALQRIALALCYDLDTQPHAEFRMAVLDQQDSNTLAAIIQCAFVNRGEHDPAPRAMEASHITVELELDYGAYRDLQRHRMLTPAVQILGCSLGPTLPSGLELLGVLDRYQRALGRVVPVWQRLVDHDAFSAQYVVPLAYRIRTLWTLNLREVFHVIELRSARQGHASYRGVAQALYREVCRIHPWLADLIRVDLSEHTLARG